MSGLPPGIVHQRYGVVARFHSHTYLLCYLPDFLSLLFHTYAFALIPIADTLPTALIQTRGMLRPGRLIFFLGLAMR